MRTNDAGSGAPRRPRSDPQGSGPDRPRAPLPTRVEDLPALPPSFAAFLATRVPAVARPAVDGHVRLLLAWNVAINLTAISDPAEVAIRHVADSLAAHDLIEAGPHANLIDLGSGGGFPGLPLAAALPGARVLLVEATAKKARFLETVVAATGLADRVAVRATRAEALAGPGGPRVDVVTARAVGSLADLVEVGLPLLRPGGRLIAWKRGAIDEELAAGARAAAGLGGSAPALVPVEADGLSGHVLVVVTRSGPLPQGYPRDPGARRRRPW